MLRSVRLLLSVLTAALLALVVVPLTAVSASAAPTIVGVALDEQGQPLRNVYWDVYHQENGRWVGLQFGPKLTDANGRFQVSGYLAAGTAYRICFVDGYAGQAGDELWLPEVRHRSTCWRSDSTVSTSVETAESWTATDTSKTFEVRMPATGLGMVPGAPIIDGTFEVGKPLTVTGLEGLRPTGAQLSYQWYASDGGLYAPIPGATSATFTPTAAQDQNSVYVDVTASLSGYLPAVMSAQVNMVGTPHAQLSKPLAVTGTAAPGQTLTAAFGAPAQTYYSEIEWLVDGVPQPEATSHQATGSFPVTAAMAGTKIEARLHVSLTDADGNSVDGSYIDRRVSVQVSGTRTSPSLAVGTKPTVVSASVAGATTVGDTLAAPTVANATAGATHRWIRDGELIAGATGATYQLQTADIGHRISVGVRMTGSTWWQVFLAASAPSDVVRATPVDPVDPVDPVGPGVQPPSIGQAACALPAAVVTVKGRAVAGAKLKAKVAGWDGATVTYQWLRNGKAIKPLGRAVKASYKLTRKDRGKKISVVATGTKPSCASATATSKAKKVKR